MKNTYSNKILISSLLLISIISKAKANITIEASDEIKANIQRWISEIKENSFGKQTLNEIIKCGHNVKIIHSKTARVSAGQTGAPTTRNLTNGIGEDVYIKFDGTINDIGSHYTYDFDGERLKFTAVENLFHELSHAKHMSCGTWQYADSEGQAIRDENEFRKIEQKDLKIDEIKLRYDITGCSYEESEEECLDFFEDDD